MCHFLNLRFSSPSTELKHLKKEKFMEFLIFALLYWVFRNVSCNLFFPNVFYKTKKMRYLNDFWRVCMSGSFLTNNLGRLSKHTANVHTYTAWAFYTYFVGFEFYELPINEIKCRYAVWDWCSLGCIQSRRIFRQIKQKSLKN